MDHPGKLRVYLASTPETRAICNDPQVAGIQYTRNLAAGCKEVFKLKSFDLKEDETIVVNILRGGLNFGLRYVLADAFNWNNHQSSFISAQRVRREEDPELWDITENSYRKLTSPKVTSLVLGDVVATGSSMKFALRVLLNYAITANVTFKSMVFFTYGGKKAIELLEQFDKECRKLFPEYEYTNLIYLEGCFTVPTPETPLKIRLTGTDLVRFHSIMTPDFIESQYEDPAYPLERCIIYDAGSRAFSIHEYLDDVISYWEQNCRLAKRGYTFRQLLHERFPELDENRFDKDIDLLTLAQRQVARIQKIKNK